MKEVFIISGQLYSSVKMKKVILLIIEVIFATGLTWGHELLFLRDDTKNSGFSQTAPQREVVQESDGVTISYVFSTAEVQEDPIFPNSYFWKISGFGLNETPKEPAFLFRNDAFSIPNNCSVSLTILEAEYKDFEYELAPARQSLPDNTYEGYSADNVSPISPYRGFLPSNIVELSEMQSYRGNAIQYVKLSPIKYDYQNHKVRAYTKIKYKIQFNQNVNKASKSPDTFTTLISEDDNLLRNTILNFEETETDIIQANDVKDYLILTTPKYTSAAIKLAEWKKLLGYAPHIISKDSWTSNLIKAEVKSYYDTHPSLYYLLIIGDHEDVPAQMSKTGYFPHVTDFFYGCMEGDNDVMPDLYRGRLSVSSLKEAEAVIDKIINYESYPIMDPSFYQTGLNCAYFQDKDPIDGYADRRFAQTSEEIRSYLIGIGKNIKRVYYTEPSTTPRYWNKGLYSFGEEIPNELKKPGFAWNGNANDITNAINAGTFYVFHRDHGGEALWCDPQYTISNIKSLNNCNKLPVVFSINCLTGKFNFTSPCFAESFLRKSNGGCVAIIAATEKSYSGYNDAFACGMFDAIWPSPGLRPNFPNVSSIGTTTPAPTYTLGQILDQGLLRMAETFGLKSKDYTQYTRELFHCFGDPSMQIYTAIPTSFSGVNISRSENVSVTLSSGTARITFYDQISGEIVSQLGHSAIYETQTPHNVTICISGHNKIPYISYGALQPTIFIQNETIDGFKNFGGATIKVGSDVNADKPQGPVIFNSGQITLSGSRIEIHPNTTISRNTQFKIESK